MHIEPLMENGALSSAIMEQQKVALNNRDVVNRFKQKQRNTAWFLN